MLLLVVAGAFHVVAFYLIRRGRRVPLVLLFGVALLVRLPGWLLPPRFSEDVYRYLWDGAVQRRGLNPYDGPPDDSRYDPVRADPGLAAIAARINHRELPTIYPPFAQLGFRLAGALPPVSKAPPLLRWKVLVAVLDLLLLVVLLRLCRRLGRDPGLSVAWGWSPLCGVYLAQEAHMDILGILPLALALLLWARRPPQRPLLQGLLLGLAMLAKPLAAAGLPALLPSRHRRALGLGLALSLLCLLPYASPHGGLPRMLGSLGEYGRRWRSNDGAFAVLYKLSELAVDRVYAPPRHQYWEPWQRPHWARLARVITGRDRDTVWPDELAGFVARVAALGVLGLFLYCGLRRRLSPPRLLLHVLGAYLLLTPTLHPWYVLWVLWLCPLSGRPAPWLALGALVPLGALTPRSALPLLVEHAVPWALWLRATDNAEAND